MVLQQVIGDELQIVAGDRKMLREACRIFAAACQVDVEVRNTPVFNQLAERVRGLESLKLSKPLNRTISDTMTEPLTSRISSVDEKSNFLSVSREAHT